MFARPQRVRYPEEKGPPPPCTIAEIGRAVYGVFLEPRELVIAEFAQAELRFIEKSRVGLTGLPRPAEAVGVHANPDGSVEFLLQISDGAEYRPTDCNWRDPRFVPFDGAGIWRGRLPYLALYAVRRPAFLSGPAGDARRVSQTDREVLLRNRALAVANLGKGAGRDVVSGSWFGDIYYYENRALSGLDLGPRRHIVGGDGNVLRHPTCGASPTAYPNPRNGLSDLIAGGEGSLYHYRCTGRFDPNGRPICEGPVPVLEEGARLYAGSLPVPNVVDWNGDGILDIVSGNSEGRLLFFRNAGTSAKPAFETGVPISAGGEEIHVQPGYKGDIQGPGEARWGYLSPTVADWNEDGLLDILASDSTARHFVYINRGRRDAPRLDPARPLYLDGLDLHGTWRVKPAVAKLGARMAYVALDEDDQVHIYWRVDDYNLEDGGKLRLEDGAAIQANFLSAGGTGRLKLNLVDWNRDGRVDLLIGTPRHGSVPNPQTGLPQSLGLPGAAVLFLENVKSNAEPVFRFPVVMKHRGSPIFFGQHACGPAAGHLGPGAGPNLIVGHQDGYFAFFQRESLSPATGSAGLMEVR